jgi:4-hydroxythreonine-4-phosphate dehydrogenase
MRSLHNVLAPAKLNLFLHITGRRDDGYHLLQSVFMLIDWCDTLNFDVRDDGVIEREDLNVALPADDLIMRAAQSLQHASGTTLGAHIAIEKHIPAQAGMGGGSSDAATTLLALNRLWNLNWPLSKLMPLGLALGADVPFFWIGDPRHLPMGAAHQVIDRPDQAVLVAPNLMPVLPHAFAGDAVAGQPDPRNAAAVLAVIERAVSLAQSGQVSAICTLPIHKKALKDGAGFAFPGHTEFLAHLAGGVDVVMCLASEALRVVPATIHIALEEVPKVLTPALLEQVIRLTHQGMIRDFGLTAPRIAVAGLNPHAGEGGSMGGEELAWMNALVARLADEGMIIRGPLPADTMFHDRARASYDVAVCAYHDQALIPIKTLAFDEGVNVTLGLPFIRTSPDHGTGFDIAGKSVAQPGSVIAALRLAARMVASRGV